MAYSLLRGTISDDKAHLFASPRDLGSHRGCTEGAKILVLISLRKDQKESLAHRHSLTAFGAIQFRGVKFPKRFRRRRLSPGGLPLVYKKPMLHSQELLGLVKYEKV
jgi:hypothetical protein